MTLPLTFVWVAVISSFSILGAYYARKFNRSDALVGLYVMLVMFANVAASKVIAFDLGFATFFAPAVVLVFAVTFLLTDVVNEKFGRAETQRMILIALASQIGLALFSYMLIRSEGAPFFNGQAALEQIFGVVPRMVFASLVAFLISENADAYIFAWFKKITEGKKLWMRNVFSSLPSMALDSVLFVTIAFFGVLPIWPLIVGQIVIKWLVGVLDIPFMYLARRILS